MLRSSPLAITLAIAALTTGIARSDDEVREVKVGEITIKLPTNWIQQAPSNRLRLAQFAMPAAAGDEQPAELSIFAFGAGATVAQQVQRWRGQFEPTGRQFKGSRGKSPLGEYIFVQLSGTFNKPAGRRTTPLPGARMLMVMIAVAGKGNYFLKLVGPEKTVSAGSQAFRAAFGASADESPLELAGGE